jgi:secreted trypsin-like serine protease
VCCFVPVNAEPVGILPTPSHSRCGKKGQDSGRDGEADMAEWPWHAAILEKPQDLYVCGSTLLDESWILTAAHCVDDYLPFVHNIRDILKVRLGEYDVSTTAEPLRHEEFNITDIVVYPGFNNSTLVHDIALLRLERPAKRKQNIDVVCMPKPDDFRQPTTTRSSVKCYVTGWGRRTETSEHSLVLKEIKVPLWNHDTCNGALQAQFGPAYILPSTALCAGSEGNDACDGDGGGPLVCEKDDQWYQVGIVSFGIGCGRRNVPGVYTNVEAYGPWIEETILAAKGGSSHIASHHNDLQGHSEDEGHRHGRHNRR